MEMVFHRCRCDCTVAMSIEAVASSIIRMLLLRTNARARQKSCLCPTLKFSPPSVTTASGEKHTYCMMLYSCSDLPNITLKIKPNASGSSWKGQKTPAFHHNRKFSLRIKIMRWLTLWCQPILMRAEQLERIILTQSSWECFYHILQLGDFKCFPKPVISTSALGVKI